MYTVTVEGPELKIPNTREFENEAKIIEALGLLISSDVKISIAQDGKPIGDATEVITVAAILRSFRWAIHASQQSPQEICAICAYYMRVISQIPEILESATTETIVGKLHLPRALETPMGQTIVICEEVLVDAKTQKKTLVNTFNSILAKAFPHTHSRMSVFVAFTNGVGLFHLELICRNVRTEDVIFSGTTVATLKTPSVVGEIDFTLHQITFPEPGLYAFEVYAESSLMLESRFNVFILEKR